MDPVPQKTIQPAGGEPATIGGRPEEHLDAGGQALQGLQAANTAPQASPHLTVATDPAIASLHKEQNIPKLRTFESDAAEAAQKHNLSAVSIAAQKIQEHQPLPANSALAKSAIFKKVGMFLGALALIVVSIGGVTYALIASHPKAPVFQPTAAEQSALINADDTKDISLGAQQNLLSAFMAVPAMLGGETGTVVQVNTIPAGTTTPLDGPAFLAGLDAKAMPSWLARAVGPSYSAGFYRNGSAWEPFMIFSVISYDDAFAGMLQWENGMAGDLAPLYAQSAQAPGMGTSTSSTSTAPVILAAPPAWNDTFIDNRNVRAFSDASQSPFLLYAFPIQNVLVITTSQEAMSEIFSRLTNRQLVR